MNSILGVGLKIEIILSSDNLLRLMLKEAGLKSIDKSKPFVVSTVWREPRDHLKDHHFCITKITGFSLFSKHKMEYPNTHSALKPFPQDDSKLLPKPPES
jgi:hypothetical protein